MFRKPLLTIIGLLCFFGMNAQGDTPILLTSVYKKVKYAPGEGMKFTRAMEGQSLKQDGILKLCGKATARLYCNGKFVEVNGKGGHKLSEEVASAMGNSPFGFANRFNDFLMAANEGSGSNDQVRPPDSGSGWGDEKRTVSPGIRLGTVGGDEKITFSWSGQQPATGYDFKIVGEGDQVVYQAETMGPAALAVDLKALNLKPGKDYYWEVKPKGATDAGSGKLDFKVEGPSAREKALAGLKSDATYEEASAVMKKLMEAAAYEDSGFYYTAMVAYTEALKQNTDNEMAQKLQQAFVKRMGLK
ncbi:MAG: hypothetical protein KDC66_06430 [Phaeodactylibacter sp.]|nr:hypothetical protein [Phaeodactylibacter sp.]MCB9277173.1 hypothetical protein [Lewinellaceae bacterium]